MTKKTTAKVKKPATTSFFTAKPPAAESKKRRKGEPTPVRLEGLECYAQLCALEKAIQAAKETLRAELTSEAVEQFVLAGRATRTRPENFKAAEGEATASIELRQRSSASELTAQERRLLRSAGVSTKKVEIVAETFRINPAYATDTALLDKVNSALQRVRGIPDDFIELQEGVERVVVSESALSEVFAKKIKPGQAAALLGVVGTLAIKPVYDGDISKALRAVKNLLA